MTDAIDQAIEVLNRALETDPLAINMLFKHRVGCNENLANDPTIQVKAWTDQHGRDYSLGALGLINGLFGVIGSTECGYIGMDCDIDKNGDVTNITGFRRIEAKDFERKE